MSRGIRVAKPNKKISDAPEDQYIDSDTPIFKQALSGFGELVSDGSTRIVKWTGKYGGTTHDSGSSISYTVTIPHGLDYTPTFIVYADLEPGERRIYVTILSSVNVIDGVFVGASCDRNNLTITWTSKVGSLLSNTAPPAGSYGYFFYIFYDQANAS